MLFSRRNSLESLAASITWRGSRLTYLIGQLFVDAPLKTEFLKAYAYFRWIDDVVDEVSTTREERLGFIRRQDALVKGLFSDNLLKDPRPEEELLVTLIQNSSDHNNNLKSFLLNMFAIIKFDAYRKGRYIFNHELNWYSNCLGMAVVDGLQYFIGHHHDYPKSENRYAAAIAAHITHLLRDTVSDISNGFINIPCDVVSKDDIRDFHNHSVQGWVKKRVLLARKYFKEGKEYIKTLPVKRCQWASSLYCVHFEKVLDAIERDNYLLRPAYK